MSISNSSKKPRQTQPTKRRSLWDTISLSHLPITYRLPLLIGALLFAVIGFAIWTSYREVQAAAIEAGHERLQSLTQQLTNQSEQSLPLTLNRTFTIANDPAVRSFLRAPSPSSKTSALNVLQQFMGQQDSSGVQLELWTSDRSLALTLPENVPAEPANLDAEFTQCASEPFRTVGAIRVVNNAIAYTVAAAVKDDAGKVIGYLVRWRRVNPSPNVRKQLSDLLGGEATLYYGNAQGGIWTDLEKVVPPPPVGIAGTLGVTHYVRDGNSVMALGRPIRGTPWFIVIEFPDHVFLNQASHFLRRILVFGIVLFLSGIAGAILLSRNVTQPLKSLTAAASTISRGDYSPVVDTNRSDEIGALLKAFNVMTIKVRNSQRDLEKNVRDRTAQLEAAAGAILMVDSAGLVTMANIKAAQLFGYDPGELVGKPIENLVPERYRNIHPEHRVSFLNNPSTRSMGAGRDLYGRRKDGTEVPIEIGLNPIQTDEGAFVLANIIDITERKRAEERFRVVVEASPSAILMVNAEGRITLVNGRTEELFGYTRSELLGEQMEMLVPERYRSSHPGLRMGFSEHPSTREMGAGRDLYGRRKDGSEVPIEIGLNPIRTNEGLFVLASIIDITERKRGEEQLHLQSTALESAANAIMITDVNGKIVWVNKAFSETTGYSFEEVLGKNPRVLRSGKQDDAFYKSMWQTILSGRVWRDTVINRRKDGSLNHEDMTITPIRDGAGKITQFVAIKQDITQLQQALSEVKAKGDELAGMTQQLWQASRLATVGELAASVAHELNNPLATISLRLETLGAQLSEDEQKSRAVQIVSDEVERMGKLVSNLLQFSRRTHQQISTLDVREEIDSSFELIEYHLRSNNIQVVRKYAPNVPTIQADRQQLRQVFLNLLANASDAMMNGGEIIASVGVTDGDRSQTVRIDIIDNGPGIPAANLEKIWDPFFTTKPEGKGTGLGLAICRRVVEEHHGSISIDSRPGEGTTVTINLPSTNGTFHPEPAAEILTEMTA